MPECGPVSTVSNNRYWLISGLSLSVGANPLTWNPYPTEFRPYSEVEVTGDGEHVGLGYVNFKWTSGAGLLTAQQGNYLMSFFSGSEPDVQVFARTRVDTFAQNVFGEWEFTYTWYRCRMKRPTWTPYHGFRLKDVVIEFHHAVGI